MSRARARTSCLSLSLSISYHLFRLPFPSLLTPADLAAVEKLISIFQDTAVPWKIQWSSWAAGERSTNSRCSPTLSVYPAPFLFSSHVNSNGKRIKSFFSPLSFPLFFTADRSSWSFHFVRRKNERRHRRHAIPHGLRPPRDAMLDFAVQMLVHSNSHSILVRKQGKSDAKDSFRNNRSSKVSVL